MNITHPQNETFERLIRLQYKITLLPFDLTGYLAEGGLYSKGVLIVPFAFVNDDPEPGVINWRLETEALAGLNFRIVYDFGVRLVGPINTYSLVIKGSFRLAEAYPPEV